MSQDTAGGMVFSFDDETDNIVAAVQRGDITHRYECTLASCDNPVCVCGTVYLSFSPLE